MSTGAPGYTVAATGMPCNPQESQRLTGDWGKTITHQKQSRRPKHHRTSTAYGPVFQSGAEGLLLLLLLNWVRPTPHCPFRSHSRLVGYTQDYTLAPAACEEGVGVHRYLHDHTDTSNCTFLAHKRVVPGGVVDGRQGVHLSKDMLAEQVPRVCIAQINQHATTYKP